MFRGKRKTDSVQKELYFLFKIKYTWNLYDNLYISICFLGPDSRTSCQRTFTLHAYAFILKGNFKGKLMKAKILENSEIAL